MNRFTMPEVGIVILAGGEGRRIGGQKPEKLFQGRRLIDIAVARAKSWNAPAVVCVRRCEQASSTGLPKILDRATIEGPLGGLLAAFDWAICADIDRFLTIPCDMPFLPDDLMPRLVQASVEADRPAVAVCDGRRHPICAVWPRACRDRLDSYSKAGGTSLAGALDLCLAAESAWGVERQFANVNSLEDLHEITEQSP